MSVGEIIHLDGHIQSIYLAVYEDKLMLLDGCCRSDVKLVLDYIKNTLKRPITDLKVVLVTHMHPDHAGGAMLFKKKTGCSIIAADSKSQWYSGIKGRVSHAVDVGLASFVASRMNKPFKFLWYPRFLSPDLTVKDGDSIPGFEDWKVVSTPGHTDRDLSIYHPETQVIYTADLIIKLRHKFVSPMPIHFPKIYNESLRKVKALEPKLFMLAHGGKMHIPSETLDSLISHSPKKQVTFKRTITHKLFWKFKKNS